jgi:lipopolysaccharide transport system permease protein
MGMSLQSFSPQTSWKISSNFLRKIYIQRGLIRNFVVRDLKSRYIGSFMGFFWSVIHPLVLVATYTFVFSIIFKQKPQPDTGASFAVSLFCSILPWLLFQDTLQRSSTIIIENTNLVTKTLFPSEILPLVVLLSGLVNHLIGFAILLSILLFTIGKMSVFILLIPVYIFLLMLFTLGISWFVASLNVFIRDVSQMLSVILPFWFWVTPIFFSMDQFPQKYQKLLFLVECNPLGYIVIGYRDCLLQRHMPDLSRLAIFAVISMAVFFVGGTFFRKTKREFADIL